MALRVMIVDDEEAFVDIGEQLLSRAGFAVTCFFSAQTALKALPDVLPDLILSDVEMPLMDGFEFLKAVRADPVFKKTAFALMTARRTFPPDRVKGLDLGSDDYISKPFSGAELVARVKAILRRSGKKVEEEPEGLDVPPPSALPEKEPVAETSVKTEAPAEPPPPPKPQEPEVPPPPPPQEQKQAAPVGAPEPPPVFAEIRKRLEAGAPVAVILANLSFFRGYNDCLGFQKGDEVLRFTLDCLQAANRDVSGGKDTVVHLYADEFLMLSEPARAVPVVQAVLHAFTRNILMFYGEEDLARGFIEGKNRQRRSVAHPFVNLVMAVVTNANRRITHPGHFIHIGREILAYAKTLGGSRYVQDRRKDPAPGS